MYKKLEECILNIFRNIYKDFKISNDVFEKFTLELPPEKFINDFDFSTNIALIFSKYLNMNPMDIANTVVSKLQQEEYIERCEIVKPAFINIKVKDTILIEMINDIISNGDTNLVKNLGNNSLVNVEFFHFPLSLFVMQR